MQLCGQITSMSVSGFRLLIFKTSMADYLLLLRSVEVQTVRDIQDRNYRICFDTLGAGLPINLLTSG